MSDIKPCPLCKGEEIVYQTFLYRMRGAGTAVTCRKCGLRGPVRLTREGAVKAWNMLGKGDSDGHDR